MTPWFKTITQSTLAVGRRNLKPGETLRRTALVASGSVRWTGAKTQTWRACGQPNPRWEQC